MNSYNHEQYTAFEMARRHLKVIMACHRSAELSNSLVEYLQFRQSVDRFLQVHFSSTCHERCYRSRLSACCSKEGIITFFADIAVNTLLSAPREVQNIMDALEHPLSSDKCVYLGPHGCLWKMKPIVCVMFICDRAQDQVFGKNPELRQQWEDFQALKKRFTWPDRPVLFDDLESVFMDAGHTSSLMYLHNSPGLLRLKQKNGINDERIREVPNRKGKKKASRR